MTYTPPVDAIISQHFGDNPNSYQPGGHTGVDYAVPVGTPIHAIGSGTVMHAGWASDLGWPNPYYVAIDFDGPANGDQSAGIVVIIDHGPHVSIYAHFSSTDLNIGDTVQQGQVIGLSGMTGRSTGPHLHFEILPDGWDVSNSVYGRIDPLPLISGAISAPSNTTEGFLMALSDQQQKDIYWMLCKPDGRAFMAQMIGAEAASKTLNTEITRGGKVGGKTSLAGMVAWNDEHVVSIISAVAAQAASGGASIDQIKKAVTDAIASGIDVNVTVKGPE